MGPTRVHPIRRVYIRVYMQEEITQDSGHTKSSDGDEDIGVYNDSFVYTKLFKNAPKAVKLMWVRRTRKGGGLEWSIYTTMISGFKIHRLFLILSW